MCSCFGCWRLQNLIVPQKNADLKGIQQKPSNNLFCLLVCLPICSHRPVAHLMSDRESNRQPRILVDVAAAVGLTHPGQMGQTQSLARLVHSSANVFPGRHSQVMFVQNIYPT